MTKAQHHQTVVNENDLWETPPSLLAEIMKKYDIHPILDVCATFENNKCENCHRIIGKSSPTYDSAWIIFRKKKEKQ